MYNQNEATIGPAPMQNKPPVLAEHHERLLFVEKSLADIESILSSFKIRLFGESDKEKSPVQTTQNSGNAISAIQADVENIRYRIDNIFRIANQLQELA